MISIIICSRDRSMLAAAEANIKMTVGDEHEVVAVDNSGGEYSIFTAYNEGAGRAKGDILCFMHEDVIIYTEGWGRTISAIMESSPDVGLIGVLGSQAVADAPGYWSYASGYEGDNRFLATKIVLYDKVNRSAGRSTSSTMYLEYSAGLQDGIAEARGVDGLFFAVRRSLFDEGAVRFDDRTFTGFHFYDMDICMQVAAHSRVVITNTIFMEHATMPKNDGQFYLSCFRFYEKWRKQLPSSVYPLADTDKFNQQNAFVFFSDMYDSDTIPLDTMREMARKYYFEYLKDARRTKFFYRGVYLMKYGKGSRYKLFYKLSRMGVPIGARL